jgi:hypothetical protein
VAIVLGVGLGWFIRLAAQPRTLRAALAAAAATGLIATLVALSVLGPMAGTQAYIGYKLRMHPVQDPADDFFLALQNAQGSQMIALRDAEYLAQYLSAKNRPTDAPGHWPELNNLQLRAVTTNRAYAAIVSGWVVLLLVLVLCLGFSLESTWAADYLVRSGRGLFARVVCYLELYPPAAALLAYCVICPGLLIFRVSSIPWAQWLLLMLGAAFVGLAHAGVILRWSPSIRLGLYVALVGWGVVWGAGYVWY